MDLHVMSSGICRPRGTPSRRTALNRLLDSWATILAVIVVTMMVLSASMALAHERRKIGNLTWVVGWYDEPSFTGFKNGVQLRVLDAKDKPVEGLEDTLKVEVVFGEQKSGPLALAPAFRSPGEYRAQLVPTRSGTYTFRFTGTAHGRTIDESFTCSEETFDCPVDTSEVAFPAKDPSSAELAGRLERLGSRLVAGQARIEIAQRHANLARSLAVAALVVGVVGLVVSLNVGRRKTPAK